MSGSMFDNPGAFAPFYSDSIVFETTRSNGVKVRTTIRACELDVGFDDPFNSTGNESERVEKRFLVRRSDLDMAERPKARDTVVMCDGTRYSVVRVSELSGGEWAIDVRGTNEVRHHG